MTQRWQNHNTAPSLDITAMKNQRATATANNSKQQPRRAPSFSFFLFTFPFTVGQYSGGGILAFFSLAFLFHL
jgi:hypothetical protein